MIRDRTSLKYMCLLRTVRDNCLSSSERAKQQGNETVPEGFSKAPWILLVALLTLALNTTRCVCLTLGRVKQEHLVFIFFQTSNATEQ